jgi:hypothetical protein
MRLVVCCFAFALAGFAQSERGSITGTVSDPANAVIPHATVVARNTQTGVQYRSVTTQTGDYTVAELPAGSYDLNVEASGFGKFVQHGIRIYVEQAARIDVVLHIGAAAESVSVTAEARCSERKTRNRAAA